MSKSLIFLVNYFNTHSQNNVKSKAIIESAKPTSETVIFDGFFSLFVIMSKSLIFLVNYFNTHSQNNVKSKAIIESAKPTSETVIFDGFFSFFFFIYSPRFLL